MRVKFLTLNILHGGVLWDNLVEFIHTQEPDIMTLQEVYGSEDLGLEKRFRTVEEFKKEFEALPYHAYEPTVIDLSSNQPWGNAVFSKFPILENKNHIFNPNLRFYDLESDPNPADVPEGMLETLIDVGGVMITVVSWHGIWDSHGGDTDKRFEMEKIIVEALRGKKPLILAGDANIRPDTGFVRNIEEKLGITDIFGMELVSTFNMKQKTNPEYATESVDKIFVSPEFKVVSKEMPKVDVSDHYPLVAVLEI